MGRCGVKGRVAWKACCRVHRHVLHKLGLHLWSSQEVYALTLVQFLWYIRYNYNFQHSRIFINTPPYTLYRNQQSCFRFLRIYICRGTQREILRKRPENNNKAWIKLSEAILSILGDCWEKIICSSLPAGLIEEFPASKVLLHSATWFIGKFPSRRMSKNYKPVWVWLYGE